MSDTATWSPDASAVTELTTLLQNCMSPQAELRTSAMDALKTFELQPEFFNYLCYILIEGESDATLATQFSQQDLANCRATAGMLLKNSLLDPQNLLKHSVEYVKRSIVHGLYNSSNALVGNVTGIVIAALFSTYYRQHRDDATGLQLLAQLLELCAKNNTDAAKALSKVVEDNATFFGLEWAQGTKPMQMVVEQCLVLIDNTAELSPQVRAECIKCLGFAVKLQSQWIVAQVDTLLSKLFQLCQTDSSDAVMTQLCVCFTLLLETRPDKLADHLAGIVQFMLHVIGTATSEPVAIEACEFLHTFVRGMHVPKHMLQPFVGELVPVLLTKMVYDSDSITVFEANNEADAFVEDKDEDIKPMAPRIVKKKEANSKSGAHASAGLSDDESDDDDDDDDEDGDVDSGWTLRKCSAATLDALTTVLPRDVIEIAFPLLRQHLTAEQWFVREATVLALGAMAEGGMKYFSDQLPALIPFLVEQLRDTWAPVRRIVCWTLSRFSPWILQDHTEFLLPVLQPIVQTLVDRKKDVQEAAISAVAVFIENCDAELIETLLYSDLLRSFDQCFQLYKKKNLIILYDAVGRFAEKVELDDDGMSTVLPHLINKWGSLPDQDKELWPLLECLSCVASSLGERFAPMAPEVYARAYRILSHCVEAEKQSQQDPSIPVPEKDFTITSVDLIDGIVQGLGAAAQPLLFPQGDNTLLRIMLECLQDPVHEVRQSVFALLGDIVTYFPPQLLSGYLAQFIKFIGIEMLHNDDFEGVPSVVNAVWALGIVSERVDLAEYVIDLAQVLVDLLTTTLRDVDGAIVENVAITIGRLCITHPEVFAQGKFAQDAVWSRWCDYVNPVDSLEEKSSAYLGLLKCISLAPQGVLGDGTLHKIVQGLSVGVETSVFQQEIMDFLVAHQQQLSQLRLGQHEMSWLQSLQSQ